MDEDFLLNLPDDNLDALAKICQGIEPVIRGREANVDYLALIQAYALLQAFRDNVCPEGIVPVELSGDESGNKKKIINSINQTIGYVNTQTIQRDTLREIASAKENFASQIGKSYAYEFEESDFKKIQDHINNIRSVIQNSKDLDPQHRDRLLATLEQFQKEFHKRMGNLDRAMGTLYEIVFGLRHCHREAEPIIKDVKGIFNIFNKLLEKVEGAFSLPWPLQRTKQIEDKVNDDKEEE